MEEYNSNSGMVRGVIVGFLSAVIILLVCMICKEIFVTAEAPTETQKQTSSKADEILDLIDKYYYYTDDDYSEDIEDGMLKGLVSMLDDKYAAYYSAEEWKQMLEEDQGIYYGIGVVVQQDVETGEVIAVTPYENGPAYAAGIRAGDIIIAVDGQSIVDMTLEESVGLIRGPEGTTVTVTVRQNGEVKDIVVTRQKIENVTVIYEMLEDNIGYIRITGFENITSEQFERAVNDLKKQGVEGFVFDVRSNGGGYYHTVCEILDIILPEGKIVYIEDKYGKQEVEYSDKNCIEMPMCVLVDGYTASSSEIFAGAIQDYNLGPIIGKNTYGKGIVQNTYVLRNGGAVKFTIASYFTPNGRNIHGQGIKPDIEVALPTDESAYEDGVLLREFDTQLAKAVEYIKGVK